MIQRKKNFYWVTFTQPYISLQTVFMHEKKEFSKTFSGYTVSHIFKTSEIESWSICFVLQFWNSVRIFQFDSTDVEIKWSDLPRIIKRDTITKVSIYFHTSLLPPSARIILTQFAPSTKENKRQSLCERLIDSN